jgi:hypothetical protein
MTAPDRRDSTHEWDDPGVGFEAKGLGKVVLALLLVCIASWAGLAVLIALSITAASNQATRLLLLVWVLAIAGWFAVYAGQLRRKLSWWLLAVMAPALPIIGAALGFRGWWKQ